jgi:Flp pilus assembly protein TadG
MNFQTVFHRIRNSLRDFRVARGGNVAITFAFATIPIIGAVGAGFDYSHANSVKADLQAALDSTALMLAKDAATTTAADLNTKAMNYFTALFNRPGEASISSVSATYTASAGSQVIVNGAVSVPTTFLRVLGPSSMQNITVTGSSTTKWGSTRLRVALVLDNTGSMAADGKMTALKSATQSLLTQLKNAASTNGDVYVSIVPFVKDVNLDPANYNSNWIDWANWEAAPSNSTPSMSVGPGDSCPYSWSSGNTCLNAPGGNSTSTVPSSGTYAGYICPSTANGCFNSTTYSSTGSSATCTGHSNCSCSGSNSHKVCSTNSGYYEHAWIPNAHSTWNGCVVDRGDSNAPSSSNYDTNVVAPSTTITATLYSAEQYSSCPQPVKGLSYDWTGMSTLVNNMSPAGSTNQAIGLQIGWQSLAGGGPFSVPAMDSNYTYQQAIILLTDGLNTQDRWYGNGSSLGTSDDAKIDAREAITCSNIKAANITLYTIQVNTGGDPTSTLLQSCATSSDKFFLLTSASGIATVFNQIGTNLTKLRVAR